MRKLTQFFIVLMICFLFVSPSLSAKKERGIPFEGMSMVYQAVDQNGDVETRTVSVLSIDEVNNRATVRDSQGQFDVMEVDLETREVVNHTGGWPYAELYIEDWIPTKIKIGSSVKILHMNAVVIGSTVMQINGRDIKVWKLQATYNNGQNTWYYDVATGLWVAAAWIEWDSIGNVIANWGGHLVSTNVVLGGDSK